MKVLEDRLYLLDGSSRVLVHSLDELLARLLYAVFQWIKIDHNLAVIPHPYAVWVQKKSGRGSSHLPYPTRSFPYYLSVRIQMASGR